MFCDFKSKVSSDYGKSWMDQESEMKLDRKGFSLYPEQGTQLKEWITDISEVGGGGNSKDELYRNSIVLVLSSLFTLAFIFLNYLF